MTERLCPGCGLRLTPGKLGQAPLDRCLVCAGVWLGTAALRELLTNGEDAACKLRDQTGAGRPGRTCQSPAGGCPDCGSPLAKIVVPDIPRTPVYACAPCRGFWLTPAAINELIVSLTAAQNVGPEAGTGQCVDCGEHNPSSAVCCWACGRVLQGVAARACPGCQGVVRRIASAEVNAGGCESCGGAWLPAGALNALLFLPEPEQLRFLHEVTRLRSGTPRNQRDAQCPACEAPMRPMPVGAMVGQTVQSCPHCGASFVPYRTLEALVLGKATAPGARSR